MTGQAFSLVPFPLADPPDIAIAGAISLLEYRITLSYSLAGTIEDLMLPPHSDEPRRKDELWKATCFEMFVAIKGQPRYWEFNFSPSGDWNVYRMAAYRRLAFGEELSVSNCAIQTERSGGVFRLSTSLDLNPLMKQGDILQAGLSAVIQTRDGNESYWALTHPGDQPDFHLRESFILELAGQTQPSTQPAPAD